MPDWITLDGLLNALQSGGVVLLPNHRAARELRAAYDARQRERGLAAWQPAAAIAWSQWTNGLYSELIVNGAETRLLLNAAQEQSLWTDVITDDPPEGSLDSANALAELAASAFRLAAAWTALGRLRSAANAAMTHRDARIFARWAAEFQQRCHARKLVSPALLEAALKQHVEAESIAVPRNLQLAGFVTLTPAQQALLNALAERGAQIEMSAFVSEQKHRTQAALVAESPSEELQLVAQWLRRTLEDAQNSGRTLRIAVLVPGLDEERAALESVLRVTLAPELQAVSEDLSSTPWEFAVGVPLSSLGMVADALDIARWMGAPLPQARISALLLSPYLSGGEARETSAQLDALIRRKENLLRPELTLTGVVSLLEKHRSTLAWPRNLATELARSGDLSRPRSYADWMELLRVLIRSAGWPNSETRELTAAEFEATRAWDGVLDLVATLDFSGRRVAFATALEALELHAQMSRFSPPPTGAPVQIMTPAEAEGSAFDAAVFLRATDDNWPSAERTHPLLPWQLQKELNMPGTDPVRSAERAREFTQKLLASCGDFLFTYANSDANGLLRPSPLLAEFSIQPLDPLRMIPARSEPDIRYERALDEEPLPPLRKQEFHGGASLLKLQAACGFLAFAQLRLNAAEPESREIGLDARETGNVAHQVLHLFWGQIKDQETLASLSAEERREALRGCIEQALASESRRLSTAWDDAYMQMLRERLLQLLMPWLERELERAPFEVAEMEVEHTVQVGRLQLRVRLDRIDNVLDADGERVGKVYIDYKTGAAAHPSQWLGERPDEPQLPLYTLLSHPEKVMGVAFARLRAGETMKYTGLQAQSNILDKGKKQTEMVQQIKAWRQTLTQLAEDFASGRAHVDPKKYPVTCGYCGQRLLCRLDPATLKRSAEEEVEDSDG